MKFVYKYPIKSGVVNTLTVPHDAKVLHVAIQNACICLWIMVDTAYPNTERDFKIFGTGMPVPYSASYIGTVQDLSFVWHIFEVQN